MKEAGYPGLFFVERIGELTKAAKRNKNREAASFQQMPVVGKGENTDERY